MDIPKFNITEIFKEAILVVKKVIKIPLEFWFYTVPDWFKIGLAVFFVIICLVLIILAIKNRNAWTERLY